MKLTVCQTLPALDVGGVERGTLQVAAELVRRGHRSLVISSGGRLVRELEAGGSEHIAWTIGRKTPLGLRLVPRLRRLIRDEGIHILHARSRFPAWLSWLALRTGKDTRHCHFVTSVHGPYSVNRYSAIMTRGERIIAISAFIRDYIETHYPQTDASRVRVIHRGVDSGEYPYGHRPGAGWQDSWRHRFPEFTGKTLLALPARITRWKGQEDFIRVIGRLVQAGRNVHGLVAGGAAPGKERFLQQLQELVRQQQLQDRVSFLGHRDDLREVMAVSAVVLSLAQEPEAFGRTSLEALSLGVPVVAYDHGGASEVLQALYPAGLTPPLDPDTAATKVAGVLDNPGQVRRDNPFTLEAMLGKTVDLYEQLCHGSQPAKS